MLSSGTAFIVVNGEKTDYMQNRYQDWYDQAEYDLQYAEFCIQINSHEWACFAAHQAAEKAVKAVHLKLCQKAYGHVISQLLDDLPEQVADISNLYDKARVLDSHYYSSRYPCCFKEGAPCDHYGTIQSKEVFSFAREIVEYARDQLKLLSIL